jgi:Domain of unknown function (DUF4328)
MPLTVACPSCTCLLGVPDEYRLRDVRCAVCGGVFRPEAATRAPAAWQEPPRPQTPQANLPLPRREEPPPPVRRTPPEEAPARTGRTPARRPIALGGQVSGPIAMFMLVICAVLYGGALIPKFAAVEMWQRIREGAQVAPADRQEMAIWVAAAYLLPVIAFMITAIPFWVWQYASHNNLTALGDEGLTYSPAWAVGSWFVPFADLWWPFEAMQELWKGSSPSVALDDPSGWRYTPGSWLVRCWWLCWVIWIVLTRMTPHVDPNFPVPADMVFALGFSMVIDVLACVTAILALFMIKGVMDRQRQKAQQAVTGRLAAA